MKDLKVSIVIPAYDEEKTIEKTIKSLLEQTYGNFEITVIDNNSQDKTAEISKKLVRTILETNQGYIFAVKRGINETDGEIVTVCDADTIYPSDWLSGMVKSFRKRDVVAVYGTAKFHDTGWPMAFASLLIYSVFLLVSKAFGLDNTAGFNFLFRRDAYETVGGYDESWKWGSPDIEFGKRLGRIGRVRLKFKAVKTSSRRFRKGGFLKTARMFLGMWRKMLRREAPEISYEDYNKTRR